MNTDGFDTTIVLSCGDRYRINSESSLVPHKLGDWESCPHHSKVAWYDRQDGSERYGRDVRIVEIIRCRNV